MDTSGAAVSGVTEYSSSSERTCVTASSVSSGAVMISGSDSWL